jgi:hypothetical protein
VNDLVITDIHGSNPVELPRTYTREEIPVNAKQIPKANMIQRWHHLRHVAMHLPKYHPDLEIGILVGSNCPAALEPLEVVPTNGIGPFATRLHHGWTVYGSLCESKSDYNDVACNRIMIQESFQEIMTPMSVMRMFELDFNDRDTASHPDECGMSREDAKFLQMAEEGTVFTEGHYTLPLPFREPGVMLPCNKSQVTKRTLWQ